MRGSAEDQAARSLRRPARSSPHGGGEVPREVTLAGDADAVEVEPARHRREIGRQSVRRLGRVGVVLPIRAEHLESTTFAVGFALKDSLSNFASGVLTLVMRPYRVGDSIDVAGVRGTVKEIRLFVTVKATGDNVQILVPNARIYDGIIRNFSVNSNRRIGLVIGIGYDSSIKTARNLLEKILSEDERILEDPAPFVGVAELADSSVNFVVRPWVKRQDHWATKCDLTERIKLAFDEHGIEMPYPQRTIHMAEKTV